MRDDDAARRRGIRGDAERARRPDPRDLHATMLRPTPFLALLLAVAQPARHEILRGRVTDAAGAPVPGAEVIATRAPDRAYRVAHGDSAGAWRIDWPDGTGDYLVRVAAPGFDRVARRVVRAGAGAEADSVLVVDVVLARTAAPSPGRSLGQPLAAVVTRAPRTRPDRAPGRGSDVGASERFATDPDLLPPASAGDLHAAGALIPDIVATPNGISVLGLGPAQNAITLNGMAFGGTQLPRDVAARVRVATSSYDPSIGWFSGARTNVQLASGGLFTSRSTRVTGDAPALQANDAVAKGLGQRVAAADASLAGDGPLGGPFTYNAGVQASRRTADLASLATADAELLRHAGVAPDSAARLLQLLGRAGVPLGRLRDAAAATDHVVLLGRVDHAPYDWDTLRAATTTWGLTAYGDWTRRGAVGRGVTGTPAHAGASDRRVGFLGVDWSRYLRSGALATVRTGVSADRATGAPDLALPDGRVRVASDLPDAAASGLATLSFGGNGALRTDARRWTWESAAELEVAPAAYAAHRVKLAGDVRLDGFADRASPDALGTFTFNSLADLAANRAAAFTRTLGAPTRRGREWNAFVSAGDLWRATPRLQVLYGARLEASTFADTPASNPAVTAAFGARTDRAPSAMAVLPRAGFTFDVPGPDGRPTGSVRGGVGAFRNLLDPRVVAGPSAATGLPDGVTRLACVGAGVPTPDWSAFARDLAAVPDRCAGSVDGVLRDAPLRDAPLRDAAPDVQLVDPRYRPQQSWRSNLSWTSSWRGFGYVLAGVYTDDRHQPNAMDLNFAGVPRFTLGDEGRPVFVSPASVVAATGAVSPVEARRSAAFGRVTRATSDLRGVGRQATALVYSPLVHLPNGGLIAETAFGYALSSRRAQQSGFGATTFGDPSTPVWARGDLDVRHRVTARALLLPFGNRRGVGMLLAAQAQSGMPFTPMVAGDVNGDGLTNDRAFVHDSDLGVFASAPARVRRCLTRQTGAPTLPNSCTGPWSASLDANLVLGRGPVPLLPQRADVVVAFTNVLGGVDRLLHGSDGLRGWGAAPAPDPVLYAVRGFDPSTRRFRYEVNPRFGDTRAATTLQRAPFRVTIDVRVDIAPPHAQQQLDRWLQPGRTRPGVRLDEAELARRLERNVPDPYAELLAQTDSLLLTPDQVVGLRAVRARYRARMDSTWRALAHYLDALPDRYDARAAFRRTDGAIDDAWELTRLDVHDQLPRLLTPAQLTTLGGTAGRLWSAQLRLHDRRFVP